MSAPVAGDVSRPGPGAGRDLTTGSIPRHLIAFALPLLVGNVMQTAYSFINAVWVGQYLGTVALAAITVSFPVVFVLIALSNGLTLAATILIAQHTGARDQRAVRQVVQNSTLLLAWLSLALVGLGEALAPWLLRAMGTPPEVLAPATDYLRIFLLSLPFGFGLFLIRSMLQGLGDSRTPLYFQSAALLLNAGLDPLLMFGWAGLPRLGLAGTAWGSVIAQGIVLLALFAYLQRQRSPVSPDWTRLRLDRDVFWMLIKIGMPVALQQSLVSVGMVFVVGIVNGFGEPATAAFGAAMRIDQVAFLPALSFSLAVSTLTGQNIGANRYARVSDIFNWGILLSGGITLIVSALAVFLPGPLLRIFLHDPEVVALGISYLRIVGVGYVFFAVMFVSNGIINGAGHTMISTLITLVSLWGVRVPMAYALSRHLDNVNGVWYAITASFFVAMTLSLSYYGSRRWERPVVKRPPVPLPASPLLGEPPGAE